VASADLLRQMNVEIIESDRGGDITFHGPGQIVAYPIVRLADRRLSVGAYVKTLEHAVIATLASFGVEARLDPGAIGVWTETPAGLAKICALGVRIKRGVSMHGVALNVRTDLSYFNLIVPCGLAGRPVTSLEKVLDGVCPPTEDVAAALGAELIRSLR
jgi:lipoate-protein ligase B